MTTKTSVCIIGAGIGGLTAGALLTKNGYNVEIFEKEHLIGGRALSIDDFSAWSREEYERLLARFHMKIAFAEPSLDDFFKKGLFEDFKLDLGYHAIGGGVFSNLNSVLSEFDMHLNFMESSVGFIRENGWNYPFLSRIDKIKILPNILRLLLADEKKMRKLDSISMTETIKQYGKGKMTLILEIFSRSITTVNNLDLISTGEMFRAQKNLYRGSKPVGYPVSGLNNIHSKLKSIIMKNGGKIHLGKSVEKILIEGNQAKGVLVNNDKRFFDVIVSNVMIQDLLSIIDKSHFNSEFITNIQKLQGTASLCSYFSLSKVEADLLGKTFHFIERNVGVDGNDAVGMIDFMAADPQADISPSGKFLVQAYIICTPREATDPQMRIKLRELLDKNLSILIPDYKDYLEWSLYPVIWHLDGVAKTIDNIKPSIKTSVDNLFLIGDCVKAPGIGVNCAINSARFLVDILLKKK
jgi:protoporphyrinogen oxidase